MTRIRVKPPPFAVGERVEVVKDLQAIQALHRGWIRPLPDVVGKRGTVTRCTEAVAFVDLDSGDLIQIKPNGLRRA